MQTANPWRLTKRVLRHTIGWQRLREAGNRIRFAASTPAFRRFEDSEVQRLQACLPARPKALVATVIATYNRPDLLRRAVASALAQTEADQIVFVVDDGGGLPELPSDPRLFAVSLSRNTKVQGLVRNIGIRLSSSTYLAFLDDDNEWEPNHLEVALAALRGGADIVYTAIDRRFPDGRPFDVFSEPFDRNALAHDGITADTNSIVLVRTRDVYFSRIPRTRWIYPKEDWEFVYRLSRKYRVVHVDVPTVRYLVNPQSYYSNWVDDLGEDVKWH